MKLDFLTATEKKILRTTLYNDQEFTSWELELLHTPIMQRLYNLKQLGFADKVFPDAVHSRLNHVIGVAEMAERMATRLVQWLEKNPTIEFKYANERTGELRPQWKLNSITGTELAQYVKKNIPVVRLIGFLHDLTHAAFGHTLEDEVCVFLEKHDEPARQKRFFDALVAQLLYLWAIELGTQTPDPDVLDALAHLDAKSEDVEAWSEEIRETLGPEKSILLAARFRELEMALSLLMYIEFLHEEDQDAVPSMPPLVVSQAIKVLDPNLAPLEIILHRDAFFVDIVGNTICADLLDYARRDPHNSALRVQFDDRLIRYVCNVSVEGKLSPTHKWCIRLAVQFFTDKMRHDVLSEMSGILRARYLINERVLFHPTKCAAGAMLGTAVQLLGITSLPDWLQVLGDQEFLRLLIDLAQRMQAEVATPLAGNGKKARTPPGDRLASLVASCIDKVLADCAQSQAVALERVKGARVLLWRLASRRYPKPVFRLRAGQHHSGTENDEVLAKRLTNPDERFRLEREVERMCHLPPGALVIHCPKRKMSMKVAQALVVGANLEEVAHLRDVNKVTPEPLKPYHDEITAVEEMYRSIWQMHAFLDSSHFDKWPIVEWALADKLRFPNDALLSEKLKSRQDREGVYGQLAGELHGEFALNRLPKIVCRLDEEGTLRMRHGAPGGEQPRDRAMRIIREVDADEAKTQALAPAQAASAPQQTDKGQKEAPAAPVTTTAGSPATQEITPVAIEPHAAAWPPSGKVEKHQTSMFDQSEGKNGPSN